ncbi:acyl-CoA dehydrogenase family protein [Geodermatophilus ruber]|uniref:Acyl-CoA dehydrogenase n=1 Tax=Geodermatophilus ruber TaxID=504800 RepID=A0A1I4K535_9ACTN|nr:acyl-CoA dehydrogenase family protein [Geodermatophilus ruber]SFL73566.1 Acyl-CoA dehydrogenase [Geodermatophilus ruber]
MTATDAAGLTEQGADDLDTGADNVRTVLRRLGAAGTFDSAGGDPTVALAEAVRFVRELAGVSLAAAFSMWSQRMVLEYLTTCPPSEPTAGLVEALRSGEVTGSSALAPAIADLAGHGELPVRAAPDGDGWRLSGTVGWASNLFDDAVVVTPARAPEEGRLVVLFRLAAPGVTPTPHYELLGLGGTGTGGVHLDGVAVRPDQVLSDDLPDFMALCRPTMLLTQSALAVGLADAALDAAADHLTGMNARLRDDHEQLASRRDDIAVRMDDRAESKVGTDPRDLARLRLDAMDVAARAVRLESAVSGGGGYRAGSPTARRVREAAFLPVQAPSEAQLRRDAAPAP